MSNPSNRVLNASGDFCKGYALDYQAVAASQSDKILGTSAAVTNANAVGDYLDTLVATVTVVATSAASVKDAGGTAIPIVPAGATTGVYTVRLMCLSRGGAWNVTTGAGVTVVATGLFT